MSATLSQRRGRDQPPPPALDAVGIFPDDRSLIRLAGMLCIEQASRTTALRLRLRDERW